MERKVILAIDFNNILFSSYYGAPLTNSKGMNVNAIKGFFFRLKLLKEMFNPFYIVMANDISRQLTFRRQLFKPYKAQRKSHDEDIMKQMKYTSQLAALLGYPFINNELYEADDILGMISRYATENDMDTVVASSDKDLYQLVNDSTFIMSPRVKDLIDKIWIYDNYKLTPEQWVELKMLQGDASDNIPGIPGIGEVTALKLMQQFGSIDSIYNHLGSIKATTKNALINFKSTLPLMRTLVTIITDYTKIELNEDKLKMEERFINDAYDLIAELEIPSLFNVIKYSLLE